MQKLLKQDWDHIFIQGASAEPTHPDSQAPFHTYGAKLAEAARATGAQSWLYVTWAYHPTLNAWMAANSDYAKWMDGDVQLHYLGLSRATGVPLINVGAVWKVVRTGKSGVQL